MNRARILAHRSLTSSLKDKKFCDAETDRVLKEEGLSAEDRALYTRLYYGVTEKKITLDYYLSRLSTIPLNECQPEVLALLELGAYQLLYMDRIPPRAVLFEAGEIAKRIGRGTVGYVNALLRRIASEKDRLEELLPTSGKKALSLKYGYPRWLVSLWLEAYGAERCREILVAQNTPAAFTLRINTLKITMEEYARLLEQSGIPYHKNPLCRFGLTLKKNLPPAKLPGYKEGYFFIQDAAAQHATDALEAKPEERILDLCAAPGGKSFGAAMDLRGKGEIFSAELHPFRLERIRSGAERLGISILKPLVNDSSRIREEWKGSFHRVICDVPCSGYGTIAKKPDIRHKNPEEANELPALQRAILESGASALMTGGRLVYSTCTLNPRENEAVTDSFLADHPEFFRVHPAETIFPVGGENDGFFLDILEKTQ